MLPYVLMLSGCINDTIYMQPSRIAACDSIKLGMTFEQMTEILGNQTNRTSLTQGGNGAALETYKWDNGPVVMFLDRKVFSVTGCN